MKRSQIITLIFLLITIIIIIFVIIKNNHETDEKIVKCIASKSTLYISTGCSACKHQEELFGDNFKYLKVIDCAVNTEKCLNIQVVPTWIINSNKKTGVQTIENLKEFSGC